MTVINEDGLLLAIFHGRKGRGEMSNIPTLMLNTVSMVSYYSYLRIQSDFI